MFALIGRRILIAVPTLFLVSLFVFALQRALPGDPFLVVPEYLRVSDAEINRHLDCTPSMFDADPSGHESRREPPC